MSIEAPAVGPAVAAAISTSGDATGATHRYIALDALRGVAALSVLFYHLRNLDAADRPIWAAGLFASGYLAVDLFFVLSGFVIAHAYEERLARGMAMGDFLLARFIRLQPVIAMGTLLGLIFALAQRSLDLPGAAGFFAIVTSLPLNLAMLPNVLAPQQIFLLNPPAWSLFYELLANTGYALLLRRRKPGTQKRRHPLIALCMAGSAALAACVLVAGSLDFGVALRDWPIALARIGFSFSLGLLLYRTRAWWTPRMPRLPLPFLLIACVVLLAANVTGGARQFYDLAFALALSPLLVMLCAVVQPEQRWRGLAVWLGLVSYPLYALHAPIKHFIEAFMPAPFLAQLAVCSTLSLGAAWIVARTLDPVIRRALTALVQGRVRTVRRPAHSAVSQAASGP